MQADRFRDIMRVVNNELNRIKEFNSILLESNARCNQPSQEKGALYQSLFDVREAAVDQ